MHAPMLKSVATRLGFRLLPVALLLLTGCFVSKEPLIARKDAAFPLGDATVVEKYALKNGKWAAVADSGTGTSKRGRLRIEEGFYVHVDLGRSTAMTALRQGDGLGCWTT